MAQLIKEGTLKVCNVRMGWMEVQNIYTKQKAWFPTN